MANATEQYGSDAPPQSPDAQDRNGLEESRQKLAQQFQNQPPDLTAGARGFSAADAALGANPFGKALMGTAENLGTAATDIAIKTPVGFAALGADAAGLNTGVMRGATDDQGHPNWSSGKVAYEHLMDAFGRVRATTNDLYLSTVAGAPLVAGAIGEAVGTPGGGGVSGLKDVAALAKVLSGKAVPAAVLLLSKEEQGEYKYLKGVASSLVNYMTYGKADQTKWKQNFEELAEKFAMVLQDHYEGGVYSAELGTESAKLYQSLPEKVKKAITKEIDLMNAEGTELPAGAFDLQLALRQDGYIRDAFERISSRQPLRADQVNVLRRAAEGEFGPEQERHVIDQLDMRGKSKLLEGSVTDHIDPKVKRAIANNDFFASADKKPGDYEMFRQPKSFDGHDATVPHWSDDGGVAFGMKYYAPVAETLETQERRAFQYWHSQGYDDFAQWIRTGSQKVTNPLFAGTGLVPDASKYPAMVAAIESALAKFKMPENVVMFRGVSGPWAKQVAELVESSMSALKKDVGSRAIIESIDPSAFSVSSSYDRAKTFANMGDAANYGHPGLIIEFHIPKGTPSAFIDAVVHNLPEEEWLLGFNTRVAIKDLIRPFINNEGLPGHIVLEVLPPKAKRGGK